MMVETSEHLARLLLLVDEFSSSGDAALDGLTKLAKLDFLLRYPAFLERLAESLGITTTGSQEPRVIERLAVTDPMIRYKYGPWDDRYYALVGALVGQGLVEYTQGRGKVALRVTPAGKQVVRSIREAPEWHRLARRAEFLRAHFDIPGSRLKGLIYEAFPALIRQGMRSAISASPEAGE